MRARSWVVVLIIGGLLALMFAGQDANAAEVPSVTSMDVAISINNSYAVTSVRQVITNPAASAASAKFEFRVPEEAFISNFSFSLEDRTYYGLVVPAQQAARTYERAVSEGRNAGLLEARGRSLFSFSVSLKPGQTVVVGLVFEQILRMNGGGFEYSFCLNDAMFGGSKPALNISSSISYPCAIDSVSIGNYSAGTTVLRPSAGPASTSYQAEQFSAVGNYVISYSLARAPAAGQVTHYYDGRDTYFMHVFEPGPSELGGSPMPKQVVFVLDRSGSMAGQKIDQVKSAFGGIVRQLRPEDTFNFVYFNDGVSSWKGAPVFASRDNIDAAESEIRGISAGGSTDFNGALGTALNMIYEQENSAAIVVMLTDGQPTAGVTDKSTIRSEAMTENTLGTPIYCLGFGNDVDFDFLKAISLESGARALRIYQDNDTAGQIKDFFSTVADPLMKDISFAYFPGAESHVLGGKCLYDGSQLVVVGRMAGQPSVLSVQVKGTGRDGAAGFNATFDLALMPQDPAVFRFYNFARINELLDRITVEGPGSRLVGEATNLSVENGFVTPYTSMIIDVKEQAGQEVLREAPLEPGVPKPARPHASPAADTAVPYGSELIPAVVVIALAVAALRRRSK